MLLLLTLNYFSNNDDMNDIYDLYAIVFLLDINLIDKLVELDILVPDSNYAKLSYRYNEIYNVFL